MGGEAGRVRGKAESQVRAGDAGAPQLIEEDIVLGARAFSQRGVTPPAPQRNMRNGDGIATVIVPPHLVATLDLSLSHCGTCHTVRRCARLTRREESAESASPCDMTQHHC